MDTKTTTQLTHGSHLEEILAIAHVCVHVWSVQEKRYEEAMAKFNTVLQVMGYRAGMDFSLHSMSVIHLLTSCSQPDTCYCLALCHYMLKQYAASLKYISEIIERGIKDHPELSVGMRTEGVDIRSVGNSLVCRYNCASYMQLYIDGLYMHRFCMRLNLLKLSIFEQLSNTS